MSLFNWHPKVSAISRVERIGEKDTESVAVKMLQKAFYDGREVFPGPRTELLPGITYSVPKTLAELLIEQGKAERA